MKLGTLPVTVFAVLLVLFAASAEGTTSTGALPGSTPVALSTLAVSGGDSLVLPCYYGCGGEVAPVVHAAYEQNVVDLVNAERADRGLAPLKRVQGLDQAARYHATDLGQDNYFAHDSYDRVDGDLVHICAVWSRIQVYYPSPSGENIAAGYATPTDVMNGWMNSTEGHREAILSTYSREIGVGYYAGSGDYGRYWVQDFGRRSDVYPLIINREAATTESRDVSLYVYGSWDEVRLRNDGSAWSSWMTFQNTMSWRLDPGRGDHTVWAEMRTASQTASSSDAIYLDAAVPSLDGIPSALHFVYSIPDQRLLPSSGHVTPVNGGSEDVLTWSVTQSGTWYEVSSLASTTPHSFWIAPQGFDTHTVATYTGALTVTITDPLGVEGSPASTHLLLRVKDDPIADVYLPLVYRDGE